MMKGEQEMTEDIVCAADVEKSIRKRFHKELFSKFARAINEYRLIEENDRIAGAAVFFAVFKSLANIADSTALANLGWSKNIYSMMPFIASMIILAFTSKNSRAPKAEGIPYDKGAR